MTEAEALTAAIAAEDAVTYAYGYLGPRLSPDEQDRARSALAVHRQRTYALRDRLLALQGTPPKPAVAYDIPFPVQDPTAARELAGLVEMRLAAAYADLAAATAGPQRTDAVLAAREAAVVAIGWGAPTAAFPGLQSG